MILPSRHQTISKAIDIDELSVEIDSEVDTRNLRMNVHQDCVTYGGYVNVDLFDVDIDVDIDIFHDLDMDVETIVALIDFHELDESKIVEIPKPVDPKVALLVRPDVSRSFLIDLILKYLNSNQTRLATKYGNKSPSLFWTRFLIKNIRSIMP